MRRFIDFWNSLLRSPNSGNYIPFIDGFRFLAIAPVIFQHANERLLKYSASASNQSGWEQMLSFLISRGTIGVFIFFAISGFVLTMPYAKGNRTLNYKTYISRRLTRIEPPFIFWISFFALILLLQSNLGFGKVLAHYFATLTYTHSIIYGEYSIINPVAWSLEVEIQFYLIAPFIALLYFNQKDGFVRRSFLIIFLIAYITFQYVLGWNLHPLKATLLGHLQHFLIGMLAADLYVNRKTIGRIKPWVWDALAPVILLVMAFTWTEEYYKTLIFNSALMLLLMAGFNGHYFNKFLSVKWITIIGGMCYTIYLIHLPLLELLYSVIGSFGYSSPYWLQLSISLIIAIPIVLFSSMIFFKTIEKPFMKPAGFKNLLSSIKGIVSEKTVQIQK